MATVPREVYCEFFLNGWTPVTPRQTQTIAIIRGRLDWASDVSPSRLTAKLGDETGDLNPANPLGAYYGLLNRNTPLRYGYVVLRDTFGRTSTDTWGTTTPLVTAGTVRATRTAAYTLSGTAADFDVAAGVGTMVIGATNAKRRAYLASLNAFRNIDVQVDLNLPTPGASTISAGVMLRGTSTSDYAVVEADVTSAGVVRIAIRDHDDNTYLVPATTVAGVVGTKIRLRVQVEGETLRGKLWNTDGTEPYGWHAETAAPNLSYTGWVGLRAATASTSGVTFTFDNLIIRSPRFFGVAGKLQPKTDTSGQDKTVSLEGRGIRGRMERNKGDKASTATTYITAANPLDYWPLTGGSLSEAGTNSITGRRDLVPFVGTHPSGAVFASPQWGAGNLGPWLEPGISRAASGSLTVLWAPVSMPAFTNTWTVDMVYASAAGGDSENMVIDINPPYLGGAVSPWIQLIINAAGSEIGIADYAGTETLLGPVGLFDGLAHHVRWKATQNGGSVDFTVYVDGELITTISPVGTLTAIRQIGFVGGGSGTITFAQGHAAIYLTPPSVTDTTEAVLGYRGETAGNRLARLCEANGIGFSYVGDLDDTPVMGPQYAEPLLKTLVECAETDGGTLVESRMTDGFTYLTGRSLYNKTTGVTLDFSAFQLADEFDPAFDDSAIRNKVTVRRRDGGTYTATQESGPNNVNDPGEDPDGVGVYDDGSSTINTNTDVPLADAAGWRRMLGTTPDPRVPKITVNTASPAITDLVDDALLSMEVDDKLVVTNLDTRRFYDDFPQLARGYTETLNTIYEVKLAFTTTPESPYQVLVLDDPPKGKLNTAGSVLHTAVNSSATSLDVAATGRRLWTTASASWPLPLTIAGETVSATAVANEAFTYVAAGTAAHADNTTVVPGLPAGHTAGDLLLTVAAIRNTAATVAAMTNGHTLIQAYDNVSLFAKIDGGSESAPTVSFTGGSAGDTTSAQMIALRGKVHDVSNLIVATAAFPNPSAQNIAYPPLDIRTANCVVLVIGWKQDDFTSVATLSGMTEIAEASTTTGNDQSLIWDYVIQTTATNIAGGSFTVTGGAAAVSKGIVVALRCDRQTLTVTRHVNGATKAQVAGAAVALTRRATLGR